MTAEGLAWLKGQLQRIACFDDKLANEKLDRTGSWSGFDEPGSVQIAREILTELETRA